MRRFWYVCLLCGLLAWLSPAASADQIFYAFSGVSTSPNTLTAIDIGTGLAVSTIAVTGGYYNLTGSAFDPSGVFYALGQDGSGNPVVISVNLSTGAGTLVSSLPAGLMGMEVASDGTVYFGGDPNGGELYRVPPDHSNFFDVGPMGFDHFMDFAIDSQGGLYAVASSYDDPPTGTSSIYRINKSSGTGTLVGTLPNNPCLMGIAFDKSDNLFATEFCGGPHPLYEITGLSSSNPNGATATAIGTSTTVSNLHGGDIYTPEPASLMLCLLGGVLLAARKLHS